MDEIPLSAQLTALVVLLALSAFFSMSETAMMASNRFRLRHLAQSGHHGAREALALLNQHRQNAGRHPARQQSDEFSSRNAGQRHCHRMFGEEKWALAAGTLIVTFAILVFSEITPKIIGATHADRLALFLGYLLTPLLRLFYPVVWFINLFASGLLRLFRLSPKPTPKSRATFAGGIAQPGTRILAPDAAKTPHHPFQRSSNSTTSR